MRCSLYLAQRAARLVAPTPMANSISSSSSTSLNPTTIPRSPKDIKIWNSLKKGSGSSLSNESQIAIQTFVSMIRRMQQKKDMELMKRLESAATSPSRPTFEDKAKRKIGVRIKATKARLQIAKKALVHMHMTTKASREAEESLERQLEKALEVEKLEERIANEEKKKTVEEVKARLVLRAEQKKLYLAEQQRVKRLRMELKAYRVFEKVIERFQLQRYKEVQSEIKKLQKQELKEAREEAMRQATLKAKEKAETEQKVESDMKNVSASLTTAKALPSDVDKKKEKRPESLTSTLASTTPNTEKEDEKALTREKTPLTEEEKALELAKKRLQRLEVLAHSDRGKANDPKSVEEKVKQLLNVSSLLQKTADSLRSHNAEREKEKKKADNGSNTSKAASSKVISESAKINSEKSPKTVRLPPSSTLKSVSRGEKAPKGTNAVKAGEGESTSVTSSVSPKISSSAPLRKKVIGASTGETTTPLSTSEIGNNSDERKKKTVTTAASQVKRITRKLAPSTSSPQSQRSQSLTLLPSRKDVFQSPSVVSQEASSSLAASRMDSARKEYFALLEQEKERKLEIAAAERTGTVGAFPNVRREDLSWTVPVSSGGLFRL